MPMARRIEEDPERSFMARLRPMPGHSLEEVVTALHRLGATNIRRLGRATISARVNRRQEAQLSELAFVTPKARHTVYQ
jgi:hypothetical protein